jgi:hypothetical protein
MSSEPEILPPSTPPAGGDGGLPPEAGEPALDREVTPGATMRRESQRPRIETNTRGGLVEPKAPAAGAIPPEADEPALQVPQTSRRPRRGLLGPGRAGLFRRNLQTSVNDPQDLFSPPRAERPWRYIVLHHSAHPSGGLDQIDRDHRERLGTMGCGYHFVVGNGSETPDGRIEVARRWSEQKSGQHCRDSRVPDVNDNGIGICLVGNFDDGRPTEAQLESTRNLVGYLMERYQIPEGNVVTHDVVAQRDATCPGKNFPLQALLDRDPGLALRDR